MKPKKKVLKTLRFRLIISIPTIITLFTIASGYMVLVLSGKITIIGERVIVPDWVPGMSLFLMGLIALIGGLLLAYAITKPLKKMALVAEDMIPDMLTPIKAADEVQWLSLLFDGMIISLNQFIKDHQILDNLPEGLITFDVQGKIAEVNRVAEKILGISWAGMKDKSYREVLPDIPENRALLKMLGKCIKNGNTFSDREISVSFQQGEVLYLWTSIYPLKQKNNLTGAVLNIKSMNEIDSIRKRIQQTEQLALVGSLAAGMAHEIRNPLGSIRGLTELIHQTLTPEDKRRVYTDNIIKEIDRLNRLVEELFSFAHAPNLSPETGDINRIVEEVLSFTQYKFPNNHITINARYNPTLPQVWGDRDKLREAFLNILLNAFQSTPEGRSISVFTEFESPSTIVVGFANTGTYIPIAEREKIFLPFFTTRGKGTGLGLPITQQIVSSHHGKIEVESDLESGTIFRIKLPIDYRNTENLAR